MRAYFFRIENVFRFKVRATSAQAVLPCSRRSYIFFNSSCDHFPDLLPWRSCLSRSRRSRPYDLMLSNDLYGKKSLWIVAYVSPFVLASRMTLVSSAVHRRSGDLDFATPSFERFFKIASVERCGKLSLICQTDFPSSDNCRSLAISSVDQ